jgi:DNA-binding LacI/PurR family transcriptional regulator
VIGNAASNAARRTKSKPSRQSGIISACINHREEGHRSLSEPPRLVVQLERLGTQQASAIEEGASCAGQLLSRHRDFTALMAFNDISAIGAINRFREHGWRIPRDLSVVGFDDVLAARISYPPLTTVR